MLILDHIDELLESCLPNVREQVIHLFEEILRRNESVKLAASARESFEFTNVHFQAKGHRAVRIRQFDDISSQNLDHD